MHNTGWWYDIAEETWQALRFPPYPEFETIPNNLYSFRGLPTIFGNSACNSEGECESLDIIQYNSDEDIWYTLGEMLHPRQYHEVIEVPSSFCVETEYPAPR